MKESVFGENLRYYRKKAGLTQKELGEKSGIGQVVIANYERGARFPGESTLRTLAETLNVSLDFLLSIATMPAAENNIEQFDLKSFLDLLMNEPVLRSWEYIKSWKKNSQFNIQQTYSNIIIKALHETGDLWFKGELSIVDEHLISSKLRELITLASVDKQHKPPVKKKWLGFCAPGEQHDLVLLMTAQLMQIEGWEVQFIGTGAPMADLIRTIEFYNPHVVCISTTIPAHLDGLETYLQIIDEKISFDIRIILGGRGVSKSDLKRLPKVYGIASSLEEGILMATSDS